MEQCTDWVQVTNLICNTVSVVALAWIGGVVGLNRRDRMDR